jgi:hypothetical protein
MSRRLTLLFGVAWRCSRSTKSSAAIHLSCAGPAQHFHDLLATGSIDLIGSKTTEEASLPRGMEVFALAEFDDARQRVFPGAKDGVLTMTWSEPRVAVVMLASRRRPRRVGWSRPRVRASRAGTLWAE